MNMISKNKIQFPKQNYQPGNISVMMKRLKVTQVYIQAVK
jgi:hypothetical protein